MRAVDGEGASGSCKSAKPAVGNPILVNASSAMFSAGPRTTSGTHTLMEIGSPRSGRYFVPSGAIARRPLSVSVPQR